MNSYDFLPRVFVDLIWGTQSCKGEFEGQQHIIIINLQVADSFDRMLVWYPVVIQVSISSQHRKMNNSLEPEGGFRVINNGDEIGVDIRRGLRRNPGKNLEGSSR